MSQSLRGLPCRHKPIIGQIRHTKGDIHLWFPSTVFAGRCALKTGEICRPAARSGVILCLSPHGRHVILKNPDRRAVLEQGTNGALKSSCSYVVLAIVFWELFRGRLQALWGATFSLHFPVKWRNPLAGLESQKKRTYGPFLTIKR